MATTKVRCPQCGAKNTGEAAKCRICGQDLRGTVEQPLTMPEPGSAQMRSGRLSGLVAMAAGGVLLLLALALVLGIVPSPRWLSDARNSIPLLSQESDDGWTAFVEPSGRWRAEMPVDRTESTVAFPLADTGSARQWTSRLGGTSTVADTELSVIWTTVPAPAGENVAASLATTAQQYGESLGGRVERNDEATFRGLPARRLEVSRLRQGDEDASVEALLVRRGEQLVILQSRSVYPDHPQFGRLVEGFSFV
jgi:hypothetical protein